MYRAPIPKFHFNSRIFSQNLLCKTLFERYKPQYLCVSSQFDIIHLKYMQTQIVSILYCILCVHTEALRPENENIEKENVKNLCLGIEHRFSKLVLNPLLRGP